MPAKDFEWQKCALEAIASGLHLISCTWEKMVWRILPQKFCWSVGSQARRNETMGRSAKGTCGICAIPVRLHTYRCVEEGICGCTSLAGWGQLCRWCWNGTASSFACMRVCHVHVSGFHLCISGWWFIKKWKMHQLCCKNKAIQHGLWWTCQMQWERCAHGNPRGVYVSYVTSYVTTFSAWLTEQSFLALHWLLTLVSFHFVNIPAFEDSFQFELHMHMLQEIEDIQPVLSVLCQLLFIEHARQLHRQLLSGFKIFKPSVFGELQSSALPGSCELGMFRSILWSDIQQNTLQQGSQ